MSQERKNLEWEMHIAVSTYDYSELQKYFKQHDNIDAYFYCKDTTLLRFAVSAYSVAREREEFKAAFKCFAFLLECGADPYKRDISSLKNSSMHVAAIFCRRELLWYFFIQGYVDENTEKGRRFWTLKNGDQKTPIYYIKKEKERDRLFLELNAQHIFYKDFIARAKDSKDQMEEAYYKQKAGSLLFNEAKKENLIEFYVSEILNHYFMSLTTYNNNYSKITGKYDGSCDELLDDLEVILAEKYSDQLMMAFENNKAMVSALKQTFEKLKQRRLDSQYSSSSVDDVSDAKSNEGVPLIRQPNSKYQEKRKKQKRDCKEASSSRGGAFNTSWFSIFQLGLRSRKKPQEKIDQVPSCDRI